MRKSAVFAFLLFCSFVFDVRNHAGNARYRDADIFAGDEPALNDSVFLSVYSGKLGVPLDSNCNRELIATIAGWVGVPYRRAGYSKAGIDCSGFVSRIYKDVFCVDLTHSSSAMISQMKHSVLKSGLKEGDILFFRIGGSHINHVGLYIKDHKFIHASPARGIVVDDLRQAYYQRYYYTAGRP
ncbi:MAG: NlpC/P60 family protein [Bacteroidota bacterium]|nr:NlpC/P60 family protein [Bacteroidota bacterium]